MDKQQLLKQLEKAWAAIKESYAGLSDSQLTESGVMGNWSVKDILAHVTTWEEEALKYLPLIITGGRPPRYTRYGGIDAFNAQMTEQKRGHPKRARRALHTGDALPASPPARYIQPLPQARQGDTGMAGAASRIREVQSF